MLPSPPPAVMKAPMPSYTATQTTISAKLNQPFQIQLHVTSGTGYSWQPVGPMPPGVILLGAFQQPHGKIMPGGPGTQILVFRGTSPGKYKLQLEYVRPWEHNAKPAKVQPFTVTIQ